MSPRKTLGTGGEERRAGHEQSERRIQPSTKLMYMEELSALYTQRTDSIDEPIAGKRRRIGCRASETASTGHGAIGDSVGDRSRVGGDTMRSWGGDVRGACHTGSRRRSAERRPKA
jgi:hypothetical protein